MDFQITADIAAPPEVVWSVMSDAARWHEWTESVRRITILGGGPIGIGTRALVRQPGFPPAVWTVIAFDAGRSFTWKTGFPGMWVHARHSVMATGGGTRATLALHFTGVMGPFWGRMTQNINNRYLELEAVGLKWRSEQLAAAAPG
jgi:hypothetical protein